MADREEDGQDLETTEIKLGMTRSEAYQFLVKLTDDDFRSQLEKDPIRTLARERIGIWPPDEIPDTAVLPPVHVINQLLETLGEPDDLGNIPPEALGWGVLCVMLRLGFAMPFMASPADGDAAR